jgi:DNA-binding MarR family transcriptional regulator
MMVGNDGSMTEQTANPVNELQLLEALEHTPETTQADLAARLGVAVGTVNWYLKRWSNKGYVKIRRIGRWKWSYLLTPEGIARKARLASEYIEASMTLYRRTRSEAQRLLGEVRAAGYHQVSIGGDGEIADICRLTCLEMDVRIAAFAAPNIPVLQIEGTKLALLWPHRHEAPGGNTGKITPEPGESAKSI